MYVLKREGLLSQAGLRCEHVRPIQPFRHRQRPFLRSHWAPFSHSQLSAQSGPNRVTLQSDTTQHTLHTDLITSVQCCYWTHRCHTWRPSLLKHRYTCRSPGHTGCPPHSHMTESKSDQTCPAHILRKKKRGLGGGGGVCVSMCMMIVWPLSQREPCDPAGQRHSPVRGWHEAPFTQSQRCWQPEPNRPAGHAETHTHTHSQHTANFSKRASRGPHRVHRDDRNIPADSGSFLSLGHMCCYSDTNTAEHSPDRSDPRHTLTTHTYNIIFHYLCHLKTNMQSNNSKCFYTIDKMTIEQFLFSHSPWKDLQVDMCLESGEQCLSYTCSKIQQSRENSTPLRKHTSKDPWTCFINIQSIGITRRGLCVWVSVCVCVCVCVCGHVYVVYEDTNLYNDMGMT